MSQMQQRATLDTNDYTNNFTRQSEKIAGRTNDTEQTIVYSCTLASIDNFHKTVRLHKDETTVSSQVAALTSEQCCQLKKKTLNDRLCLNKDKYNI